MSEQYTGTGGGPTIFADFESLGYNDRIYPSVEKKNWQAVENGLRKVNTESFVLQEGAYIETVVGSTLTIHMEPINTVPSFEGVIANEYFRVTTDPTPPTNISWDIDISLATTVYLYLKPYTGITNDHSVVSSLDPFTTEIPPLSDGSGNKIQLLMGVVTITAPNVYTFSTSHLQKMYYGELMAHRCTSNNPHGASATQTNLTVTGTLTSSDSLQIKEYYQNGTLIRHETVKKISNIAVYTGPGDLYVIDLNLILTVQELDGKTAIIDSCIVSANGTNSVLVIYPFDADSGNASNTVSLKNNSGSLATVVAVIKYRLI